MSIRSLILMITPTVAGVALGYLFGGRLAGFHAIRIRALWLVWLAAGVQFAQYSVDSVRQFVEQTLGVPMLAVVFALVLTWLTVNTPRWPRTIRVAGVMIFLGASLNGVAILLNGRMPYEPAAAGNAGVMTPKNEPAAADTRLAVLGDTIPIRPLRAVISPGDILIGGGAGALVVITMRRHRRTGPAPEPDVAEEVNNDPHPELAAHRLGDRHAGSAGDPALHGRRTDDRG